MVEDGELLDEVGVDEREANLGVAPVRESYAIALLVGGGGSLVYGATKSLALLLAARCVRSLA